MTTAALYGWSLNGGGEGWRLRKCGRQPREHFPRHVKRTFGVRAG